MDRKICEASVRHSAIKLKKDEVRAKYKKNRRALAPEERAARDAKICEYARGLVSFRFAEYVLMYAATPDEIDIYDIARAALAKSKNFFFDRWTTLLYTS